jgi:hypothetical protein
MTGLGPADVPECGETVEQLWVAVRTYALTSAE